MLKALDTIYDGHRFRSRTEARWAVFFKTFGVAYQYEPQGYLVDGKPYLPDFLLPELNLWLEVKGGEPTDSEKTLLRTLARETCKIGVCAVGPPRDEPCLIVMDPKEPEVGYEQTEWYFAQDRKHHDILWLYSDCYGWICPARGHEASDKCPTLGPRIRRAYQASQVKRFEHCGNQTVAPPFPAGKK